MIGFLYSKNIQRDLLVLEESLALLSNALLSSGTSSTVALTAGLSLLLESALTGSLGLSLDDVLNDLTLVLESVTLGKLVKLVVEVLVDLARVSVLNKKTTEDTGTSHPDNLGGHTGVSSTLSLTVTGVSTGTLGLTESASSGAGMASGRLVDDKTISNQLADGLTRVGLADFSSLVGIEPDLSLTNAQNAGGKSFLKSKVGPVEYCISTLFSYSLS